MDSRPNTITLHEIAHDYINNIIQNVKGSKAIILDKETQVIFALETSKSFAIKEEIFMFQNIEKLDDKNKYNMEAIFFIRPTETNLNYLRIVLNNMTFKSIHLSNIFYILFVKIIFINRFYKYAF
jgi:hypothetical protein